VALIKNKLKKNIKLATRIKIMPSTMCPVCKNTIPLPHILSGQELTRYGIKIRSFFDWCFNCDQGVQSNDFLHNGVWFPHKWRSFMFDAKDKLIIREWVIENELPAPLVIVGPGSDYDKSYSCDNLFNIFTNFVGRVAGSPKKRLFNLSARNLLIQ